MAYVPCNGCTACCKGQRISLTPKEARSGQYIMEPSGKLPNHIGYMLAHRPNGDCIYLNKQGCSIHGRAPKTCRDFDCRVWLKMFDESDWDKFGPLDKPTVEAAKARL